MRALTWKLLRDLWAIKGQAFAIAMVIAAGVTMYVMYLSAFDSLRATQRAYYERYRFADVFASLKRAPSRLRDRIVQIPGVAQLETRVVVDVALDVPGLAETATGRLISVPSRRRAMLNDLFFRVGRYVDASRAGEVLVSESFALAHDLEPGDTVTAVINGRRQKLEIVGITLSPEYVYSIRPGEIIPDDARFGIFWMERRALATAFDMEGGFNDVAIRLGRGASEAEVIARLDRLLEPYGGLGAIPRSLQFSHWYLDSELTQLQSFGVAIPLLFLGVAAFLLNVVLTRIVAVQREQIAMLKALGYANREVGLHYVQWGVVIAAVGTVIGIAAGRWFGSGLVSLYSDYFRFPVLIYRLMPVTVVTGVAVSAAAAVLGALGAVRQAVRLPLAEAMRPEPPKDYRESWIERVGLRGLLSPPARMVARNLQRQPFRTVTSIVGIAFGAAILIVGTFFIDAMDELMEVQFQVAQRQDVTVSFVETASARAFHEVTQLPGVISAEPMRVVPARLRSGHRVRQLAVTGLPARPSLHRVVDRSLRPIELPPDGLVLSAKLGELLAVGPGDTVYMEVLEGARPVRPVVVNRLVEEYMGMSAYMEIDALRRVMREGGTLSGTSMAVDRLELEQLYARLKETPAVAGVALKWTAIENFDETLRRNFNVMIFFNILFSSIIAFGVVYNAASISLSERSWELASLRVLGFTRAEISAILLGELGVVTLIAIPVGLLLGYGLAALTVTAFDTELYRFPLVVTARTFALAALVILVAATLSGLSVRRKLDQLDLVAVLKTRE